MQKSSLASRFTKLGTLASALFVLWWYHISMATVAYALTTRQKVKDFLNIQDNTKDAIIDSLINGVTDFIENYVGGRRFKSTSYVEIKDTGYGSTLFFNQRPVISLSVVEYRTGVPATPIWLTYDANGYLPYLAAGFIRFFSRFRPIAQAFRLSYTAGYLIDFGNELDTTKHTLPFDITQVATEIVSKTFNVRLSQGIYQESTEGQSITYESDRYELNDDHKIILNNYKLNRVSQG